MGNLFGLILGNMEMLVGWLAQPIHRLIGIQLNEAEFALDEFLKRLNEELSFLVRTFFYLLLGLIFDVSRVTGMVALTGVSVFALILVIRWCVTEVFGRVTGAWTPVERRVIISLLPRGVAVAVMSFLPQSAGIPGTDVFPLYALIVIALSILFMTAALALERRLGRGLVPSISTSQPSES